MEEKIHKLIDIIGKEKYDACIAEGRQVVTCPICGRETFDNKNFYSEETLFACPHCYWKYDGVVAEGEYSADNNSDVVAYKKLYALKDELANEDSHYWQELKKYEVDAFLWNFAEPLDLDVEKVLLARTQSENQEIATYAKRYLLLAYVFGVHKIHGVTEDHFKNLKLKCDYPDYEKIKMLTPKVVLEWNDVNSLLYAAYEYVYDVTALEAALLAVEGELYDKGMKTNGYAKSILFHLYRFGKYETLIYDRDITINAPELKDEEKYNFFYKEYEVFLKAFGMEHMPDPYEPMHTTK